MVKIACTILGRLGYSYVLHSHHLGPRILVPETMFCLHRASFLYGPWDCPSSWSQHIIHGIYTFYFWSGNFQGRSWVRSRLLWKILTCMLRPDLAKNLLVNLRHSGTPPFSSRLLWFHLCYSMISCALRLIPRICTNGKTKCVQIDDSQVSSQNWNIFHRFYSHQDPCISRTNWQTELFVGCGILLPSQFLFIFASTFGLEGIFP